VKVAVAGPASLTVAVEPMSKLMSSRPWTVMVRVAVSVPPLPSETV
jgi:hypothetical protein